MFLDNSPVFPMTFGVNGSRAREEVVGGGGGVEFKFCQQNNL